MKEKRMIEVTFQALGGKYRLDVYMNRTELIDTMADRTIKEYLYPVPFEEVLEDCRDYKDDKVSMK